MRVLVLGVTGMLGNAVFRVLSANATYMVWGTMRSAGKHRFFEPSVQDMLFDSVDASQVDSVYSIIERLKPEVVINCIGMIKQDEHANDPLAIMPVNALFPHQLARFCARCDVRVIHISTDCVFSGRKGAYNEDDVSDVSELYGRSKSIGELVDYDNALTLRTSIIGHELSSSRSLVDWFLSQEGRVKGYQKAIFSGLPTTELAKVIANYVLTNTKLHGLYHVAAAPINKYALLKLVAEQYQKHILIEPDNAVMIDRSLDAARFKQDTGYSAPSWKALIKLLHKDYQSHYARQ